MIVAGVRCTSSDTSQADAGPDVIHVGGDEYREAPTPSLRSIATISVVQGESIAIPVTVSMATLASITGLPASVTRT